MSEPRILTDDEITEVERRQPEGYVYAGQVKADIYWARADHENQRRDDTRNLIATIRHEHARADEAERLLEALAEHDPCEYREDNWYHWCAICDVSLPGDATDHNPDCPWRLAREHLAERAKEATDYLRAVQGQPADPER